MFSAPAPPSHGESGWNLKTAILFGAVFALLFATIYLFVELDKTQTDLSKFKDSTLSELASLRDSSASATTNSRKDLAKMSEELEAARKQANIAVGQAKTEAIEKAKQLAAAFEEEQRRQNAKVTSELSEVKEANAEASTKIGAVSTDVTAVKTDVAATKEELEKTVNELKRVNGDMGVMSGLIATNGKELNALKQLGDRNYFEFNLARTKGPQKVGDIAILLKGTDPKKNKYTINVVADDKTVEKKDKNVNEPLQFYVARARQPYEIVVNEVKKNQIVGYLATPKVQQTR